MGKRIQKHVHNYLLYNNIITCFQSGFTAWDSSINQLVELYNTFGQALDEDKEVHVRIQRGRQGVRTPPPPEKSQKYRVSYQYWSRFPEKAQGYQASIQCWAIIGTPAKRHLNDVSLAG